jgi:hypothetical protein
MDSLKTNIAIDQLTFSLFQRPLHPELFDIHARRQVKTEDYAATFWITGCTYVIGVFSGDTCLSEIVSTPKQPLPAQGLLERFRFSGPGNYNCTLNQGIRYTTDYQIEETTPDLYEQKRAGLERLAHDRGLFVQHPALDGSDLSPFCYIDFEARRTELHIHTVSAYPHQTTLIKTESLFTFT